MCIGVSTFQVRRTR
ncbi:hypothetical protein [Enterovibrio baiacu]